MAWARAHRGERCVKIEKCNLAADVSHFLSFSSRSRLLHTMAPAPTAISQSNSNSISSTLSASSANSTGIAWNGRKVLTNPLDNGIQPHVPHWIIVILILILATVILVTVVTAATTGAHLATNPKVRRRILSYPNLKILSRQIKSYTRHKRRRSSSMFKDIKSVWPRASIDGLSQSSEKHAYGDNGRPPPRYSEANAAPDMDDALSRLTHANTFKNQRRVAAADGKANDMSVPPILRPSGARW
ncbi:hypothetical protein C8F01DRAFT_312857 [Mycena amicta]|nr:hypothetical protein C8F01DRAFT_312857 [Mycena amicta]